MPSYWNRSLILLSLCLFTSCAAISRPKTTVPELEAKAVEVNRATRAKIDEVIDRLVQRVVVRGDRALDILLLSGGGQHGAYGIGFLRGWKNRSQNSLPSFDLVTGISTGALQAPFALLGTQAALDEAARLYRSSASDFAPTFDWFFWLRKTGGLLRTKRFEREIEREFEGALRGELQKEFSKGRQLLVATTDTDLGIGRIWDLGQEMGSTPEALVRSRKIMMGAIAIPGVFPPQVIDGHVHSDGGIISNFLNVLEYDDYVLLAKKLRARGVTAPVTIRVWAILNFFTHPRLVVMDPASRKKISGRGSSMLFTAAQSRLFTHLHTLSQAVSSGIPGLKMSLKTTSVPNEFIDNPGARKFFDKKWMIQLEAFGYQRAQGDRAWDTSVPSVYERPASLGVSLPEVQ